jgi:ribokinase
MPKVVVIGSANMDLTVRLESLPQLGETVSGGEFYTSFGGKGANQAVAAHKAGAQVRFVAKVGCDQNGEAIINQLEALGLTSDGILRAESHHSGVALIMVDRTGDNAIAVAPGSNWNLTEEDINRAESLISWGEVVLAGGSSGHGQASLALGQGAWPCDHLEPCTCPSLASGDPLPC